MAASSDPRDLYKSIVLRESLPASFRRDRESNWAKRLACIGESDNHIGGLFGKANFFGETRIDGELDTSTLSPPAAYVGGLIWTAILSGPNNVTFSYAFVNFPISQEVRDNQRYDIGTTSWVAAPNNVGFVTNLQFPGTTGLTIENQIAFQSSLLRVKTPDPNNALLFPVVPGIGPLRSGSGSLVTTGQSKSLVEQARDAMFWDVANGSNLTALGANVGIPRPPQSPFDDELFRKIGQILGWLPKTPLLVTYRLAEAIFGTQAAVFAVLERTWEIYEVNPNEIIFECPVDLIAGNPAIASYLHGYSGFSEPVSGPSISITSIGPNAAVSAVSLTGRTIYIFFSGVWNTYTITGHVFTGGTSSNLFTLNAATVPTGNHYPFFVDIPEANSFLGDFMLADSSVFGGSPNPPTSQLVYLYGQGRLDIFSFYMNNFVRASGVIFRTEVL